MKLIQNIDDAEEAKAYILEKVAGYLRGDLLLADLEKEVENVGVKLIEVGMLACEENHENDERVTGLIEKYGASEA